MKLLIVVPYFDPGFSYGGVFTATKTFAEGLVKAGIGVTILATDVFYNNLRNCKAEEFSNGIRIIRFRNVSNLLAKNVNFFTPTGLKKWVKNNISKFDIIHISDVFGFRLVLPIARAAFKSGIPYIIQPHGSLLQGNLEYSSKVLNLIKRVLLPFYKRAFENSMSIIAVSENEKSELKALFPDKRISVIANGFDFDQTENVTTFNILEKYGIDSNGKVIVFIGRLHPIKGLDLAIEILSYAKNKSDFVFLIFAPGEEEQLNILQRQINDMGIQDKVFFMGPIFGKEKFNLLASADYTLLFSRAEGLPMSVIESLSVGTPVMVSKAASIKGIDENNIGKTIDTQNLKLAATQVCEYIQTCDDKSEIKKNAVKFVKEKFSIEKIVNDAISTYNEIIGLCPKH